MVGLENQLVGQYLHAHNYRFGIYVLGTDGRKQHWLGRNGENIDFEKVIQSVTDLADELTRDRGDFAGLRVFGIDSR